MRLKNLEEIVLPSKNVNVFPFTSSTSLRYIYSFSSVNSDKIIKAFPEGYRHMHCQKLHQQYFGAIILCNNAYNS
jgi:hypothetical protein